MKITRRTLTLNQLHATNQIESVAGSHIELDPLEIAGLSVFGNPGFTLSCNIIGLDRGPDQVLFTYPQRRNYLSPIDLIDSDDVFRQVLGRETFDEDTTGDDIDEIAAEFTLLNNNTGASVIARSKRVKIRV